MAYTDRRAYLVGFHNDYCIEFGVPSGFFQCFRTVIFDTRERREKMFRRNEKKKSYSSQIWGFRSIGPLGSFLFNSIGNIMGWRTGGTFTPICLPLYSLSQVFFFILLISSSRGIANEIFLYISIFEIIYIVTEIAIVPTIVFDHLDLFNALYQYPKMTPLFQPIPSIPND